MNEKIIKFLEMLRDEKLSDPAEFERGRLLQELMYPMTEKPTEPRWGGRSDTTRKLQARLGAL